MKTLIVGYGSIGQKHAKNLKKMGVSVAGFDINSFKTKLEESYVSYCAGLSQEDIDAVLICTPPSTHIELALQALKSGKHVFIEKPLSNTYEGIDELMRIAKEKQLTVMVGYQMRYLAEIQYIKRILKEKQIGNIMSIQANCGHYLPYWRPNTDYTKCYTSRSDLGGGTLLDCSHEIDYLMHLFGDIKDVFCNAGILSDLKVDVEDTADILLHFKSGVFGNVHLDLTNQTYTRNCTIVGTEGTIFCDFKEHSVTIQKQNEEHKKVFSWQTDVYFAEMKDFIFYINDKREPESNLQTAKATLDVALACKISAKVGKVIKI